MKEEDIKFGQVYEDRDGHLYTVAHDPNDGQLSAFDHTNGTWMYLRYVANHCELRYDVPKWTRGG